MLPFLRSHRRVYAGNARTGREFSEALLWMLRGGAQWRSLPTARGAWNSVFKRFARWEKRGIWAALLAHVACDPDLQHLLIDSTIIRAHPCAAGAH